MSWKCQLKSGYYTMEGTLSNNTLKLKGNNCANKKKYELQLVPL